MCNIRSWYWYKIVCHLTGCWVTYILWHTFKVLRNVKFKLQTRQHINTFLRLAGTALRWRSHWDRDSYFKQKMLFTGNFFNIKVIKVIKLQEICMDHIWSQLKHELRINLAISNGPDVRYTVTSEQKSGLIIIVNHCSWLLIHAHANELPGAAEVRPSCICFLGRCVLFL